ncbi:hypothetical protein [Streptomyces sp. NPDC051211]|uniref:hypothetical protein n=1 Tax=Streptomyces sp. NPDC051211 TaxID=3154643 RepID=UPI00344D2235
MDQTLSIKDIHWLAPHVTRWLERGARPSAISHTLTAGLPTDLRHPAALFAHRLRELMPPPGPATAFGPPPTQPPDLPRPHPLRTCDGCERAFRAPEPGRCRDCGAGGKQAA